MIRGSKNRPTNSTSIAPAVVWESCAHQGWNGSIGCQNAPGVRSDDADDTYYESHFGRARLWRGGFSSVWCLDLVVHSHMAGGRIAMS
jgi:hypothetical protein